jgi:hypothetical protein
MSLFVALTVFNLICFYGYGFSCMFSKKMKTEFVRYGLARFRFLTGALQVAGSTGLLVGFFYEPLIAASSLGLSALMLLGVLARARIHDPVLAILPAFFFMCLNFLIFLNTIKIVDDVQLAF